MPFGLSTFSIKGIASLAPRLGENLAFQLYLDRDPAVNETYLSACRAAVLPWSLSLMVRDTARSPVLIVD